MGLSVYLEGEPETVPCCCSACGNEHTRQVEEEIYWANITHNVGGIADACGIYQHVWRSEELGIKKASQLVEPLRAGIALLKSDPGKFAKLNPTNGWGSYEYFVPWLERYLAACEQNPDANVRTSR